MIQLGSYDEGVASAAREAYLREAATISGRRGDQAAAGSDVLRFAPYVPEPHQPLSVADVQRALRSIGFFPGGRVDGICGYRTRSAIRLFQEYVRSVELLPCMPDGRFGPETRAHLERWLAHADRVDDEGTPDGSVVPGSALQRGPWVDSGEHGDWLALLAAAQEKDRSHPTEWARMVDAFAGPTDTRKVDDWNVSPAAIHLIGIRRSRRVNTFDDLFVLLIKGLVFKFQGSTDPGATSHPRGAPFLVPGQHAYRFGWHKHQQLALQPAARGVLVVRSKGDFRLDEADLRAGLESNATIHIHWGGKGLTFNVNSWSEGCQVINGSAYVRPDGERVDCSSFVARNNGEIATNPLKTRGAYNVIVDLIMALASDLPGNTVLYTLLMDEDVVAAPPRVVRARARGMELLGIV